MKNVIITALIGLVLIACREELTPLKPPVDPPTVSNCKAPSFEKNIVGTWHFKASNLLAGSANSERSGTITFKADKSVVDPDSLFENVVDIGAVLSKQFSVETSTDDYYSQFGEMLWIHQYGKNQRRLQSYFFQANSNECNRIVLKLPRDNRQELVLTRN